MVQVHIGELIIFVIEGLINSGAGGTHAARRASYKYKDPIFAPCLLVSFEPPKKA